MTGNRGDQYAAAQRLIEGAYRRLLSAGMRPCDVCNAAQSAAAKLEVVERDTEALTGFIKGRNGLDAVATWARERRELMAREPSPLFLDGEREVFVDRRVSASGAWGTFTRQPGGARRRLVSPALPMRADRSEAIADLAAYAAEHGWAPTVDTVERGGLSWSEQGCASPHGGKP